VRDVGVMASKGKSANWKKVENARRDPTKQSSSMFKTNA